MNLLIFLWKNLRYIIYFTEFINKFQFLFLDTNILINKIFSNVFVQNARSYL